MLLFSCGNTGSDDSSVPEQSAEENSGYVEVSAEESATPSEEPSEEPSIPEQSAEESSKETATIPILTADDVHFEEGSRVKFTSDKYPGKQLYFRLYVYDERIYPYPFFVVGKELFSVEWGEDEALVFEGRYVTTSVPYFEKEINPREYKVNVVVCREASLFWDVNDGVLYPIGKLIIHYNEPSRTGSVSFAVDSRLQRESIYYMNFEDIYTRDGSDYIFVFSMSYQDSDFPEWIIFNSKTGNPCSLPVPDECRWSIISIAFDTESEDPDAVIVKYRENGELKTVKA
ncbi:MAG: hypothetical protein II135_06635, partial [Clostridia bacterium]|nr:hypothetical protein [Clostridia bacterium]